MLRETALAIWQAGLAAVRSEALVCEAVGVAGNTLQLGEREFDLDSIGRIEVVGGGKAGGGMAEGLERAVGDDLLREKQISGWLNVPADCLRPTRAIHLHAARPAGVNEPRPEGAEGTAEIPRRVASLAPDDLCVVFLSGGGSALLPAPAAGVRLEDKLAITRHLSAAGANIAELNAVRRVLSAIKGGGLARACAARELVTLIISDVLGDPLETIASGPTVLLPPDPSAAREVLRRYPLEDAALAQRLEARLLRAEAEKSQDSDGQRVTNLVIGNNARAVDAAGSEAVSRGLSPAMHAATELEGEAETIGRHLANMALRMRETAGPDCLITGGEPVVQLAAEAVRGKGGRNQQLVLAALCELLKVGGEDPLRGIALLSAGTDGEDGPTDAAGAVIDSAVLAEMRRPGLDPEDFLRRNDAWTFFEQTGGLIRTGPTHTNVCDVRVVVVDRTK